MITEQKWLDYKKNLNGSQFSFKAWHFDSVNRSVPLMAIYTHPSPLNPAWALNDLNDLLHPLHPLFSSDSFESAEREIRFFFPEFCVEDWMKEEEPLFRVGQIQYDHQKLTHTLAPHSWPQICCFSLDDWGLLAQIHRKLLHAMFDIALLCVHCQCAMNTDFNMRGNMCTQFK